MKPEKLLIEGLDEIGLSCSQDQIAAFMTYLAELKKWNRAYNLTALKTNEEIVIKHFIDSLLYLRALEGHPAVKRKNYNSVKIADAGAGAGFPGIPIKLYKSEIDITLIEASRKKALFLRHIIRVLNLKRAHVINKRLETLDKNYENTFDIIVSRATFKIKDFLEKTCPYVKDSGRLILSKGPRVDEEIAELKNKKIIKEIIRLQLPSIKNISLSGGERNLLILQCRKN